MKRVVTAATILLICLLICACGNKAAQVEQSVTPQPVQTLIPGPVVTTTPEPTPVPSQIFITEYEATDISNAEKVKKQMAVYLPEGYSESGKYNAVVAMHISGSDENFWPNLGIKEIMDELTATGEIEPTIVFMPDGYINDEMRSHRNDDTIYTQFSSEIRNDLIPFIKQYYGVYEEREHYAFVGASFGSYMTVNSALRDNISLFSNFGCIGGGTIDNAELENAWAQNNSAGYDVHMLYIGEGEYDDRGPAELSAIILKGYCDKFSEDNLVFSLISGVGHDENEWKQGFMEALKLFW